MAGVRRRRLRIGAVFRLILTEDVVPKFLEDKLKREYGPNSKIVYKVMNKIGAMRGNKETAKGRAMARKHRRRQGR